ncbi:MAG: hypothetical protein ACOYLX_14205, partial [Burkholderiaceae bacterium]
MDRTDRPASAPRPPLALSMGDACGIGPEIVLKAFLARGGLAPHAPRTPWVVYGDPVSSPGAPARSHCRCGSCPSPTRSPTHPPT